ncbi:MAG: hypothetical protein IPN00_09110 [Hydrogenophilales bacterium]|nr:hypothetical protein [Hydrogenophilales bacterium]
MTTTFKSLLALLLLLASGSGSALAHQPPPAEPASLPQATERVEADKTETVDRLAWQRVGSPLREA